MEKMILKGKKEITLLVSDSIHDTIKTTGLSKEGKKLQKLVNKASKKIALKVSKKIKSDLKKAKPKVKKEKKEVVESN
jgi:seryl-tRNA synthetase